ncbi:prolyl aminopeptidase [Paludibacterium yongneupense]|uniref:prolyl aminopeptidase n=1 Tax=Paludibacterium yongneupense TaxID=400061 RepID=UPI000409A3B4|nr:prolyl aminopeptidase [Paludibacterium yongneupense]
MLFPAIAPYACGMLALDERCQMYWEQCGNPQGCAVLYLHGGPGDGCLPACRQLFDPVRYRTVLFDQRGAGRSVPRADVRTNTTWHLVDDIERLRVHLGIERWLVFGGSWGSTLALAYAQAWPQRVRGLILRGIFLGRSEDIDWFMYGMGRFFPRAWSEFSGFIPAAERDDLLGAYHRRLIDPDPASCLPASRSWARYESECAQLLPDCTGRTAAISEYHALPLARLEAHYFLHRMFLRENQLLEDCPRLSGIPGVIVQGRYDAICPPQGAYALAHAWPEARLRLMEGAGHSLWEPPLLEALLAELDGFAPR